MSKKRAKYGGLIDFDQAQALLQDNPEYFGADPEDPIFQSAVIILTRLGRRKDVFNTTRMTGYTTDFVARVRRNLITAGIWSSKDDKATYLEGEPGSKAFEMSLVMAAMCGAGQIQVS